MFFPAIFFPQKNGGFFIKFPDFPEAATEGTDLNDGMFMAKDVLNITVEEYIKEKRQLPTPSTVEQAKQTAKKDLDEYCDLTKDYFIQFFEAPNVNTRRVKVTFSLLQCELDRIDAKAEKYGMSRSALLVDAAEGYIPAGYEE